MTWHHDKRRINFVDAKIVLGLCSVDIYEAGAVNFDFEEF
jgi:hypothetical protein